MNTKQSRRHSTTANPVGITHDVGVTHASPLHHRRSIRLKGYDYTRAGAYFVTICTKDRTCLFGDVADGVMRLNQMGHIVRQCWLAIPEHFPHVLLDEFVVMPNHVRGIIVIMATHDVGARHAVGATHASPLQNDDTARTTTSIRWIYRRIVQIRRHQTHQRTSRHTRRAGMATRLF